MVCINDSLDFATQQLRRRNAIFCMIHELIFAYAAENMIIVTCIIKFFALNKKNADSFALFG